MRPPLSRASTIILSLCLTGILLLVLGCASSTSAPTPRPLPTATRKSERSSTLYIDVGSDTRANVRGGPSLSTSIIGKAYCGDTFSSYSVSDDYQWRRGKVRGLTGWVHTSLLSSSRPNCGAAPVRTPTYSPSTCSCSYNAYDCKDFSTQSSAQDCYRHCRSMGKGDIHWLDDDKDGIACEWLP
jgi:hypothetical protein